MSTEWVKRLKVGDEVVFQSGDYYAVLPVEAVSGDGEQDHDVERDQKVAGEVRPEEFCPHKKPSQSEDCRPAARRAFGLRGHA